MNKLLYLLFILLIPAGLAADFTVSNSNFLITIPAGSSSLNNFTITKLPNQSIDFDSNIIGLSNFNNSIVSTTSNGSMQVFSFGVSVPSYFAPGSYTGKIKLQSEDTIKFINVNVVIPTIENYSRIGNASNIILKTGEQGYIYFEIKNHGNTRLLLNGTSNSNIITGLNNVEILPGNNVSFPFYFNTPRNSSGNFTSNLTIGNIMIPINVTIEDSISPEIIHITREPIKATRPFRVEIIAIDNINITSLKVNNFSFTRIDNVWSGQVIINSTGKSNLTIFITDGKNNVTRIEEVPSTQLEGFQIIEDKPSQTKKGLRNRKAFLNISEDFPFTIELSSSSFIPLNNSTSTNATNFRILIFAPNGEEKDITTQNSTFKGPGMYEIISTHDIEGEYYHTFKIKIPEYVNGQTSYEKTYKHFISDYTLIEEEIGVLRMGARDSLVRCKQVDLNTLESSYTQCDNITYPANTRLKDLTILESKSNLDATQRSHQLELAAKDKEIEKRDGYLVSMIWIASGVSIFTIIRKYGQRALTFNRVK